jgi:hypothetical protein
MANHSVAVVETARHAPAHDACGLGSLYRGLEGRKVGLAKVPDINVGIVRQARRLLVQRVGDKVLATAKIGAMKRAQQGPWQPWREGGLAPQSSPLWRWLQWPDSPDSLEALEGLG